MKMMKTLLVLTLTCCVNSLCIGKYEFIENTTQRLFPEIVVKNFVMQPAKVLYENNGQTVVMRFTFGPKISYITEGPFGGEKYHLDFMYYHWLNTTNEEDLTSDDIIFPAELHAVWVNSRYANYEAALLKDLSVVITTFRHTIYPEESLSFFDPFFEPIKIIQTPWTTHEAFLPDTLDLKTVLSIGTMYDIYVGKTIFETSPDCDVGADIIWIELTERVRIKPYQVTFFNNLMSSNNSPLMSKVNEFMSPNSTIYETVSVYKPIFGEDIIDHFEGFNFDFGGSTMLAINNKFLVLIILVCFRRL